MPQTPGGAADPAHGITHFTVGTGGYSLYDFGPLRPNSVAQNNTAYGVIMFTLHANSYDWDFVPIAGATGNSSRVEG